MQKEESLLHAMQAENSLYTVPKPSDRMLKQTQMLNQNAEMQLTEG